MLGKRELGDDLGLVAGLELQPLRGSNVQA